MDNIIVQAVIGVFASGGAAAIIGKLVKRYIDLQLDEAQSSLKDREVMRLSMDGLLDVIQSLSTGITEDYKIRQKSEREHLAAQMAILEEVQKMQSADKANHDAISERLAALSSDLRGVRSDVKDVVKSIVEIKTINENGFSTVQKDIHAIRNILSKETDGIT